MTNELYRFWQDHHGPRDWDDRSLAVKKWAWAVPNEEAIEVLAAEPVVEIGAGTGYWAKMVTEAGGDVVAYDEKPFLNHYCAGEWFPVQKGGTRNVQQHADRTLFLCWPPYRDGMATLALRTFWKAGGYRMVFVGEGEWGCTADRAFFIEREKRWDCQRVVRIPRWDGIHDYMEVYTRR
jgi:hypothetical protein